MASIGKLKDRARKHEQKEDWQSAVEAYKEVLHKEEGSEDLEVELTLYNRIGDLHLRLGQTHEAVSYYETAADKYAESGFFNNAIALCNKALRHDPNRPGIYLKLSSLCAEQGFQTDARRWILEYSERQMRAGKVEEALAGLENFADLSDDPGIRETLAHQLASHDRPDEALEQLRHAYRLRIRNGETDAAAEVLERARAIDPSVDMSAEAAAGQAEATAPGAAATDFALDDGDWDAPLRRQAPAEDEEPAAGAEIEGLETRQEVPSDVEPAGLEGLEGLEQTAAGPVEDEPDELPGLEIHTEQEETAPPEEAEPDSLGGLETFDRAAPADEAAAGAAGEDVDLPEEEAEPLPLLDTGYEDLDDEEQEPEPLPLLDTGPETGAEPAEAEAPEEAPPSEEGLPAEAEPVEAEEEWPEPSFDLEPSAEEPSSTEEVAPREDALDIDFSTFGFGMGPIAEPEEDPDADVDVEAVLQRGRNLVRRGLYDEALLELQVLSGAEHDPEVFSDALSIVNEIVREDANHITALQRRVEYSALTGDRDLLIEGYLDMADALARLGAEAKAHAMYERVQDLDPENAAARDALGSAPDDEDIIDLDAILREMDPHEVQSAEQAEKLAERAEADPSFAAMLSQFKAKVSDDVDESDAGDHYDLGLAFKEMGLIDEAIAEFQTALTGGTERLKVYEELGQCYIQKNQYNVALKVLNRALQVPHADDSELLGVYYHLGVCHEELGQRAEAREAYEKVLALNPLFEDVPDRVARL